MVESETEASQSRLLEWEHLLVLRYDVRDDMLYVKIAQRDVIERNPK